MFDRLPEICELRNIIRAMKNCLAQFVVFALVTGCAVPQANEASWDYRGAWVPVDSLNSVDEFVFVDSVKMLMGTHGLIMGSSAFYGSSSTEGLVSFIRPEGKNQYSVNMKVGGKNALGGMTMVLELLSADTLRILMDSAGAKEPETMLMARDRSSKTAETASEVSLAVKRIYESLNHEVNLLDEASISKLPVFGNVVEISLGIGMLKAAMLDRYIETDGMIGIRELTDNSCVAFFKIELVSDNKPKQERGVRAHMKRVNGQWRMKFSDLLGEKN